MTSIKSSTDPSINHIDGVYTTEDVDVNFHKVTKLASGVDPQDAVNMSQLPIELIGDTLPATDGTGGRRFISTGAAAVPAGAYILPTLNQAWIQA